MYEYDNYLKGFCIRDIDTARIWTCTCKNRMERVKQYYRIVRDMFYTCKYPKLIK